MQTINNNISKHYFSKREQNNIRDKTIQNIVTKNVYIYFFKFYFNNRGESVLKT